MDIYVGSATFRRSDPQQERLRQLIGKHIVLEGTIAGGKTTLGEMLAKYLTTNGIRAQFRSEIILKNLLGQFYAEADKLKRQESEVARRRAEVLQIMRSNNIPDPEGVADRVLGVFGSETSRTNPYALSMQLYMLSICQNHYTEAMFFTCARPEGGSCGVALTERSVFGNVVFATLQHRSKGMSDIDFETYKEALQTRAPYSAHCILFLHVPVKVAMHRVHKMRRRESEQTIPEEYLLDLEEAYYEQIYRQMVAGHSYVIVVNNEDFYDPPQLLNLICFHPPPYPFTAEEDPSRLKRGEAGTVLQKMCEHYERFIVPASGTPHANGGVVH